MVNRNGEAFLRAWWIPRALVALAAGIYAFALWWLQ